MYEVRDNPAELRYELLRDGERVGEIVYALRPGTIVLEHVEVEPSLQGEGLGTRLVADALEDVRRRGLRMVPVCPFVTAYLRRHPEERDLVAEGP